MNFQQAIDSGAIDSGSGDLNAWKPPSGTVTISGTTGGTYSANPAGLSINATTGSINLASSAAGNVARLNA